MSEVYDFRAVVSGRLGEYLDENARGESAKDAAICAVERALEHWEENEKDGDEWRVVLTDGDLPGDEVVVVSAVASTVVGFFAEVETGRTATRRDDDGRAPDGVCSAACRYYRGPGNPGDDVVCQDTGHLQFMGEQCGAMIIENDGTKNMNLESRRRILRIRSIIHGAMSRRTRRVRHSGQFTREKS